MIDVGAVIIRTGFWGLLYYSYMKKPQNSAGKYLGPTIGGLGALGFRDLGVSTRGFTLHGGSLSKRACLPSMLAFRFAGDSRRDPWPRSTPWPRCRRRPRG